MKKEKTIGDGIMGVLLLYVPSFLFGAIGLYLSNGDMGISGICIMFGIVLGVFLSLISFSYKWTGKWFKYVHDRNRIGIRS